MPDEKNRRTYDLAPEDAERIRKAGSHDACSPESLWAAQERANKVWKEIGERMGFEWNTAQPITGEDGQPCEIRPPKQFTAIPKATVEV